MAQTGSAQTLPSVVLKDKPVKPEVLNVIPLGLAKQYNVVAYEDTGSLIRLAVVHPEQLKQGFYTALQTFEKKLNRKLEVVKTDPVSFKWVLDQYSSPANSKAQVTTQPSSGPLNPSSNTSPSNTPEGADQLVWENVPPPPLFQLGQLVAFNYLKRVPYSFAKKERIVCIDHLAPNHYWFLIESDRTPHLEAVLAFVARSNKIRINLIKVKPKDIDDVLEYYQSLLEEEKRFQIKKVDQVTQEAAKNQTKQTKQKSKSSAKTNQADDQARQKMLQAETKAVEQTAKQEAAKRAAGVTPAEAQIEAADLAKEEANQRQDIIRPDLKGEIVSQEEVKPGLAGIFQNMSQSLNKAQEGPTFEEELKEEPIPPVSAPSNPAGPSPVVVEVSDKTSERIVTPKAQAEVKEGMVAPLEAKAGTNPPPIPSPEVKVASSATPSPLHEDENDIGKTLTKQVESLPELESMIKSGSVPKIVAAVVSYAINEKASDVHIEAFEDEVRVRYRIDGQLIDIVKLPPDLHSSIVSRIKILTKLRLDENRVPQDGRFDVDFLGKKVDLRVSVMPTVHGEKVVMRILDKSRGIASLEELGIEGYAYQTLTQSIQKPYGIVLATGPTGSGKSTSLYAILNRIATPNVNVVTLEDPIEYEMKGINQSQIKPKIGYTFAEGLRSILRQDPNIIMVGEIRDGETANMATQAALTGHLVLSTLHTNDAAGAIPRMQNMGIEPFLITASLNVVMGQRLVRKICPNCKGEVNLPAGIIVQFQKDIEEIAKVNPVDASRIKTPMKFYQGTGCNQCEGKGYKGRIGIYEVLAMTDELEELTLAREGSAKIAELAHKQGMLSMYQDGLLKVINGVTTLDEVLRETTNR